MPFLEINGVRLYYEDHGSGKAILCIHGAGSSAMVWRSAVDPLAGLGRVIIYDRRGCARSERPDPYETSVAQHADDAAALLGALDAAPAVVIGRSYGGDAAIDLALRHPDRVRALALLEAAAVELDPAAKAWDRDVREAIEETALRDPSRVTETLYRRVLGDDRWESFPEEFRAVFAANSPAVLAEFRGPGLEATAADLSRIAVPTLLVAAEESDPVFATVNERMAAVIPGARRVVTGGGHMIDPADPAVLGFVREVLAG